MSTRREFMKTGLVLAVGASTGLANVAKAETGPFPSGIVYTKDDPGMWSKKVGSHAPIVEMQKETLSIQTKHPMSTEHFIVRHTLVKADGTVVGSQVFTPESKPISTYKMPEKGDYYATSFCNLHDFWVTKFTI